jgi:thiol-disulfide isomerase/thioredoxin
MFKYGRYLKKHMKRAVILTLLIISSIFLVSCSKEEETKKTINIKSIRQEGTKTFKETGDELCLEDGKPIIRLFSTTWCPHCKWVKETFDSTVKEYIERGEIIGYHWEVDTGDNTLTENIENNVYLEELALFEKYNSRKTIPTFVMGCKYSRIGNGYELKGDLLAEEQEFREIIEELISESKNQES